MKIIYESLHELFSDDTEMRIFGLGPYAPLPPRYTYIPKEKIVIDCYGVTIAKNIKTIKEFKMNFPCGVVWKENQ